MYMVYWFAPEAHCVDLVRIVSSYAEGVTHECIGHGDAIFELR